ncbi:hypothetical protein MNBD_GAMMA15-167 [hydrothermal vent metagenome]|uniref:PEP-CTERM protein-sorting domain-containing protein n=1 Tax=hydrothermal vent metagenome TaxID=652676 RepID=A0A3B0YKT1_9ZZZZ
MNILSVTRSAIFLGALLLSGASQAITVTFSGTLDPNNVAPFAASDTFSGSFELDESVVPTGGSTATYTGIVDNFTLDVAGNIFTGQNGRVQQFTGSGGGTDFFTLSLGGSNGTISGSVGTNTINRFTVDWRGAALFPDPFVLAQDLTTGDFSYRRFTLRFNDGTTTTTTIDNAADITFGSATVVPVPAAVWLFGSGLVGLIGVAKRGKAT